MTAFLTANNLSFRLSHGDLLFQNLSFSTRHPFTAIVGENGIGKTVLARCLSGELSVDGGSIQSQGRVHYVPQSAPLTAGLTVIQLFDLADALESAQRIAQGSTCLSDFERAQPWWERSAELAEQLRKVGLKDDLDLQRPITNCSGGEQFRLMWAAALMSKPDLFIFDEPSNHLDRDGRAHFFHWLSEEQRPLLVISHDRELLDKADAILEMTSSAMHAHPGNYQEFLINRSQRWQSQQQSLEFARKEQRRRARQAQEAFEKQQQRTARGKSKAEKTGLDKLLRDAMKQSAENSQGQQKRLRQQRKYMAESHLEQASGQQEWSDPLEFQLPDSQLSEQKKVLSLQGMISGTDHPNHGPITVEFKGAFRLRIAGANGMGKSVLMKTILGLLPPIGGSCQRHVSSMHLDQHFHHYDPEKSAIGNVLCRQPSITEQEGRERLAQVRLRNKKADIPFGQLSGGEQLKTVLATELLGAVTPQLILLDEPTNHLDLDSTLMLEQALSQYQGALIVISHDERFVETLNLTHYLTLPDSAIKTWNP